MKKIVYLIGAGASKDFGLPLGDEIFKNANALIQSGNKSITDTGINQLWNVIKDNLDFIFSGLNKNIEDYPPFEEILTFLWDLKTREKSNYDKNKFDSVFKTSAKEVFETFVKFYSAVFIINLKTNRNEDNLNHLKRYIKSLDYKSQNISFISFNYDTIIDDILAECVEEKIIDKYTYGIPLYSFNDKCDSLNPHSRPLLPFDGINLLKPHGSLNLYFCPHKQARYGYGFYYDKDYLSNWESTLKCPCCGAKIKNLFIPPLFNKKDFIDSTAVKSPTINFRSTPEMFRLYIDKRISECLIKADEIFVIGYSMPSYDFDFKSLIWTSLMQNKKRKKVSLRIITKSDKSDIPYQYSKLVGNVSVIAHNGFLNYLMNIK